MGGCDSSIINYELSISKCMSQSKNRFPCLGGEWQLQEGQLPSWSVGGGGCYTGHKQLGVLLWGFRNRTTLWEERGTSKLQAIQLLGQQK